MATTGEPLLEDILASVPSQERLDEKISDDVHLEQIGAKILSWKGLRAFLGLTRQQEEAIDLDVHSTERKRVAILHRWHEQMGVRATYRNLARAFYDAGRINLVGEVCELLGARPSPCEVPEVREATTRGYTARQQESTDIDVEAVDDTELGEGNHFAVYSALHPVAKRWRRIGSALGLIPSQTEKICGNHSDPEDCLDEVVILWLRQCYDVETFAPPSWRRLVEAVAHQAAGNNLSLARDIATKHQASQSATSRSVNKPELSSKVPCADAQLGDGDLREITGYLAPLGKAQVTALGVQLGLSYRWLHDREDGGNYRCDVADAWLKMQDNVVKVCPPTWRNLVWALQKVNQNGIAIAVERERI